ncbi:MAG: hypothetical protein ACHQNE_06185 [Candidatus Kapaibacterium sp.]
MTSPDRPKRLERPATMVVAVLLLILLVAQARLLYIFPQPDSARWWGDETGQMLELRAELHDGFARIPTGLGSSVAITNGLVRGNSWLAAMVYGVPSIIFSNAADLVTIGRTVTFILAVLLLLVMYAMLRRMQVPRLFAIFALLLLVSTRSFFFASHAARLDIAAGLTVLAFTWYLTTQYERLREGRWMPSARWYFGYGIIAVLFATLSIHLVTLLGALTLYMFWRFRSYRSPASLFAAAGGVIVMLAILLSIYALSGAPISLFGPSSAPNQFQSVAGGLPILRPFSRSVQVANVLERLHGLWSEAPAFLLLLTFAMVVRFAVRRVVSASARELWLSGTAIIIAVAWLLFQSPALYYYIEVLPLFILAIVLSISVRWKPNRAASIAIMLASILLFYFGFRDTIRAGVLARILDQDNHAGLATSLDSIRQKSKNQYYSKPLVLAQNPAIAWLEHEPSVRLMTAHLIGFPVSNTPVPATLGRLGVNYMLLYAAHDGTNYSTEYNTLRPIADSLGTIVFQKTGVMFDVHRDYFAGKTLNDTTSKDTLILYKLPSIVR